MVTLTDLNTEKVLLFIIFICYLKYIFINFIFNDAENPEKSD
jgi:hypothetical protein